MLYLALTLTYSLGGYSFDKTGTYNETDGAKEQNYNLPIYELDRWQKPGDVTDVPDLYLAKQQDRRIHPVMYIARIIYV